MSDMHTKEPLFSRVPELFIDLLLLEEFHASSDFRMWWLARLEWSHPEQHRFIDARRSVRECTGDESDLVLLVANAAGETYAVMIEDKVDAPAQPRQSARYRERGEAGVREGEWNYFITCIVAREVYLSAQPDAQGYDRAVSLESIRGWFERSDIETARLDYKLSILSAAIDPVLTPYAKKVDSKVSALLEGYEQIAREFPELRMTTPITAGSSSGWVYFQPPTRGTSLIHKLDRGFVDLTIQSAANRIEDLKALNQGATAEGIRIVPTGKSASFRLMVPPVNRFGAPGLQADPIRRGLAAVRTLFRLANRLTGF